jgi:hypothetical protein
MSDLKKEFHYYLENQDELVKKFNGMVLVIQNEQIKGSYPSIELAFNGAVASGLVPGEFLIQKCSFGNDDYTQTFHSRVRFEDSRSAA